MASTNFIANVTKIAATWLNEVDNLVHDIFNNPSTLGEARAALGVDNITVCKWLGTIGDGVTDDTTAMKTGLISSAKFVSFIIGETYLFEELKLRGDIYAGFTNTHEVDLTRISYWDNITNEYIDDVGNTWRLQLRKGSLPLPLMDHVWDTTALRQAIYQGAATVTLVGTSIAEGEFTEAENMNWWTSRLKAELQSSFPTVAWTWKNLGISGRRLSDYVNGSFIGLALDPSDQRTGWHRDATADTWSDGTTNTKTWQWHVEQTTPDLFIMAFGMTDQTDDGVYATDLRTAISHAQGLAKVPSIALVSEMQSNKATHAGHERVKAYSRLTGYIAKKNGLGLIDVGRHSQYALTGMDEGHYTMKRLTTIADFDVIEGTLDTLTIESMSKAADVTGHAVRRGNYCGASFACTFTPTDTGAIAQFSVQVNGNSSYAVESIVVFRQSTVFNIYAGGSLVDSITGVPAIAASVAEELVVRIIKNRVECWRDEVLYGTYYVEDCGYHGGIGVGLFGGATMTNIVVDVANSKNISLPLFDQEGATGRYTDWNSDNFEDGGNNQNHPSRLNLVYAFQSAIDYFMQSLVPQINAGVLLGVIGVNNISVTGTSNTDTGDTITIVLPAGAFVRVIGVYPFINPSTNTQFGVMNLKRDASTIQNRYLRVNPVGSANKDVEMCLFDFTEYLAAGTYVYKTEWASAVTGETLLNNAGASSTHERSLVVQVS